MVKFFPGKAEHPSTHSAIFHATVQEISSSQAFSFCSIRLQNSEHNYVTTILPHSPTAGQKSSNYPPEKIKPDDIFSHQFIDILMEEKL